MQAKGIGINENMRVGASKNKERENWAENSSKLMSGSRETSRVESIRVASKQCDWSRIKKDKWANLKQLMQFKDGFTQAK